MNWKWVLSKYRTSGVIVILAIILAIVAWHDPKAGEGIAMGIMGLGMAICGKSMTEHFMAGRTQAQTQEPLPPTTELPK